MSFYRIHNYDDSEGNFQYERYKEVQTGGNKRKIDLVFVRKENVEHYCEYLKSIIERPIEFGICHGTRNGAEQKYFCEVLNCEVIGTEISDTASHFSNTVQWDFHEVNPDWIGKADFIYSNSFDHAYDPQKALSAWMKYLRPGGVCLIEHTVAHSTKYTTELDPFGAELMVVPYLISQWSDGKFGVKSIIPLKVTPCGNLPDCDDTSQNGCIVLQNFEA